MSWDSIKLIHLREMWAEGKSAKEIGDFIGMSKNAVIGKSHRLGLPSRPSPIRAPRAGSDHREKSKPRTKLTESTPTKPAKVKQQPEQTMRAFDMPLLALMEPCTLEEVQERKDACLWPIGSIQERAKLFCGAPGYPYCDHHKGMAYIPTSKAAPSLAMADRLPYELRRRA